MKKQGGFTIVELLIVIVVLAILATVSISAYNGIQQRAKNAAIVTAVDSWEKAIRMAIINEEALPPANACLGKPGDFPASDGFAENQCLLVDGNNSGVIYNDADFAAWVTTSRPGGRMPVVTYDFNGTIVKGRGIWLYQQDPSARTVTLAWITQLDGVCSRGMPATTPIAGSLAGGYCVLPMTY